MRAIWPRSRRERPEGFNFGSVVDLEGLRVAVGIRGQGPALNWAEGRSRRVLSRFFRHDLQLQLISMPQNGQPAAYAYANVGQDAV